MSEEVRKDGVIRSYEEVQEEQKDNRRSLSPEQHKSIFINNYDKFIDYNLKRANPIAYNQRLDYIGKLVSKINYERNILFVYSRDYIKEVFLGGFYNLPTLRTTHFMNIRELSDLFFGNFGEDKASARPDELSMNTEYDLIKDVMCITCNDYEVVIEKSKDQLDSILMHVISRRYEYVEKDPKKPIKLSWIYFKGTMYDLENKYPRLKEYFESKSINPLFAVVDLNSLDINVANNVNGNNVQQTRAKPVSNTIDVDI